VKSQRSEFFSAGTVSNIKLLIPNICGKQNSTAMNLRHAQFVGNLIRSLCGWEMSKINPKCPKCGTDISTFMFKRKIYIVDSKNNYMLGVLYGCDKCNIAFTMSESLSNDKSTSDENVDKIQNIFGKLSKSCNKVLDNIK
jgi:hypothetical protein